MLWQLEFYRVNADGRRTGSDKITDASSSIDRAITRAEFMMKNATFHFGKANFCLIKDQNGNLVREVSLNAQRP
jgi:hypothetical protein